MFDGKFNKVCLYHYHDTFAAVRSIHDESYSDAATADDNHHHHYHHCVWSISMRKKLN